MNATTLVESQHRELEGLLAQLFSGDCDLRQVKDELGNKLLAHMLVEQLVLFPEVVDMEEAFVREAREEHALARSEIRRIYRTAPNDPSFMLRVNALKELIEHQVKKEEALLPRIDARLPADVSERIGEEMKDLYNTLAARSRRVGNARLTSSDVSV